MPQRKKTKQEREEKGLKQKKDAPETKVVEVGAILKPAGMSAAASKLWDSFVPELAKYGLLSSANSGTIADYCEIEVARDKYRKKFQNAKNHTTKHPNDQLSMSLDYKIYLSLSKESTRLQDILGISPKARKAMNILVVPKTTEGAKGGSGGSSSRIPADIRTQIFR